MTMARVRECGFAAENVRIRAIGRSI